MIQNKGSAAVESRLWRRAARQILITPLALLALALTLFEEWVWAYALEKIKKLSSWPLWARMEQALSRAPLPVALSLFCLPGLMLLPAKLGALWLMGNGAPALGLILFVLAKILGAAILGWVWRCTENTLRAVPWLGRSIDWALAQKDRLKAWARATAAGQMAGQMRIWAKERLRAFNQKRKGLLARFWLVLRRRSKSICKKTEPIKPL